MTLAMIVRRLNRIVNVHQSGTADGVQLRRTLVLWTQS